MGFMRDDKVSMYINSRLVAIGSVWEIDPTAYCSGMLIGEGNVSVMVELCMDKDAMLPFPTMDAFKVWDAFHSIVRWNIESLQDVHVMQQNGSHMQEEDVTNGIPISQSNALSYRESWKHKKCTLWDQGNTKKIEEGVIMYVYPYDSVNFELLGDDNVGVGVERSFDAEASRPMDDICSISLVIWPIKQITMLDGRALLQYETLYKLNETNDMHSEHGAIFAKPLSRKRKYCFVHRKPKTTIVPSKQSKKISIESVQLLSTIDCCANSCCQRAKRVDIQALRKEFWSQSLQTRTNYVYDTLCVAWRELPSGKKDYVFSLHGEEVCCRAWYEMHGISKTSFYRYKEQFEEGARRAVHGNMAVIRKGRDHTEMGRAIIQSFVETSAERMPHKSRTMEDGTRETLLVIPNTYKQIDILHDVNKTLEQLNYKPMSSTTFNRIWNTEFKHVTLAKTSEFSKCSICSRIKAQLESTKDEDIMQQLKENLKVHMKQQISCRNVYYTWRLFSEMQREKYLCIIHDKMDQKKTAIPRLRVKSKEFDSAYQLQVSLTGMITHGHGHGMYGHFSLNGLWPSDPNATIGSLALCLQNLERIEPHALGDLCNDGVPNSNITLFKSLNSRKALDHHYKTRGAIDLITSTVQRSLLNIEDGNEKNLGIQAITSIPPNDSQGSQLQTGFPQAISNIDGSQNLQSTSTQPTSNSLPKPAFRTLPENLLLQLDNCAAENKNRYLFAYLSLLVAKGVFKTVMLGFLMVGHTHEDIDALFSRFSEKLRTGMTFTFPHLMDTFRKCESSSPAPFLLTKIPDFKAFVDGYICDGQESLVGHSKPLQFRFYMQGDIPVMQFKIHPKLPDWLPKEGGIELWKRNNEGKPMLPPGCPNVLPIADYVRDSTAVVQGIKGYIDFWEKWSQKKGKEAASTQYIEPVISYWKDMVDELQKPTNKCIGRYRDFWPKTIGTHRMQQIEEEIDEFQGYEEWNDHYCGPLSGRPKDVFKPHIDVQQGDFVLVRPGDPEYPIWLGVTESNVELDRSSPNYKKILIQYWAPKHRKKNPTIAELYESCWEKNWSCNLADPKRWEFVDAVVWSWIPRGKKIPETVKIPTNAVQKAQSSLLEAIEN